MRIALDTNVLAYAGGLNDAARKATAADLLRKLPANDIFVPVQALGELFYVLVSKAAVTGVDAKAVVLKWRDQYSVIETSQAVLLAALELASQHHLRIWDAIMIAAAGSVGCRLLLSEDMHDGFTWSGVTVVNPFSKRPSDLLLEALEQ
jgi:predicted nucleic acid-binding protein